MLRRLLTIAILVVGVSIVGYNFTASASQGKGKNAEGKKLFMQYCASCHGADAKGTGPAAPSLKMAPRNLTKIDKVDGKFPFTRVQETISGEGIIPAHGSSAMPVWGAYLRRNKGENFAKLDLYNLTKYIESIQQ